jgi:hypothetical protein
MMAREKPKNEIDGVIMHTGISPPPISSGRNSGLGQQSALIGTLKKSHGQLLHASDGPGLGSGGLVGLGEAVGTGVPVGTGEPSPSPSRSSPSHPTQNIKILITTIDARVFFLIIPTSSIFL